MQNPVYKDTVNDLLHTSKFEHRENLQKLINSPDANKKIAEIADMPEYKGIFDFLKEFSLTKDNIVYYTQHTEFVDIFNESRRPGGENPEIGQHFGYLMNEIRPQYGDVITKGSYIELPVKNNSRDEVIAYARHKDGKTLVTIANHDVNAKQKVKVKVPGLEEGAQLKDLAAAFGYGNDSVWTAKKNYIEIDLGPGNAHIFAVDTPNIEQAFKPDEVFRQNV